MTARSIRISPIYPLKISQSPNFYTVPRMTRDIDLVVELTGEDANRVVEIFADDFYLDRQTVAEAIHRKSMSNLIHTEYVIKVDLVVRKDSPYRRMEFSRKKRIAVDYQFLYVVAPEDLILSKLDFCGGVAGGVSTPPDEEGIERLKRHNGRYDLGLLTSSPTAASPPLPSGSDFRMCSSS